MDQSSIERRADARFPPLVFGASQATLRPGCIVALIDLSAGGALVQAGRPLRPGARVHLQMAAGDRTLALGARILRCAVWALDPDEGATYRGALQFEQRCESLWECETPDGCALPQSSNPRPRHSGNAIPPRPGGRAVSEQWTAK